MRWLVAVVFLLQASSLSPASVLHWTTRLMGMECDNRPVRSANASLQRRPAQPDVDTATEFVAERSLPAGSTLRLGVCGGELHLLPGKDAATMKVVVHVTGALPRDLTPKSYLQELSTEAQSATIAWKLPEDAHPVLYVYVPEHTNLDLQFGKGTVEVQGISGNKIIHVGKGEARLNMSSPPEYNRMSVHVALGSFEDRRPGGHEDRKAPLHEVLTAGGAYSTDIHMAMGKVILLPDGHPAVITGQ